MGGQDNENTFSHQLPSCRGSKQIATEVILDDAKRGSRAYRILDNEQNDEDFLIRVPSGLSPSVTVPLLSSPLVRHRHPTVPVVRMNGRHGPMSELCLAHDGKRRLTGVPGLPCGPTA